MSLTVDSSDSRELRNFARRLGYQDDLLAEDYPVWVPGGVQRPSLVGFASAPLDMTTATFVAQAVGSSETALSATFDVAEALAAPAVATFGVDGVQVWWLGEGSKTPSRIALIGNKGKDADDFAASKIGRSLSPDALLRAKRGSIQPSLFPLSVHWIQNARDNTEDRLEDLVARSMALAHAELARFGEVNDRELTRIVLSAYTLAFIRDRSRIEESSPAWLAHLRSTHPHLARWRASLDRRQSSVLRSVMAELALSVNLSSLDPSLMSNVYERTFVTEDDRSDMGVVYTPSELARQLLLHMPVEEIAPEERRVLDPTCGSGTLLLAAHDRLRDLVSNRVSHAERHQWIAGHLTGWDKDPFAVEVARLCLTLNAFPEGNGWRIQQKDALEESAETVSLNPSIIVGNPPWKASRSLSGSRSDLASIFFERSLQLLAPGGLLGIIMPGGWLSSRYSGSTRRSLREQCEVLEIWRLPERTFRNAEAAPAVVIAKKTERIRRLFHIERRVIKRSNLDRLYFQGVADSTTLTQTTPSPAERPQREAPFMASPLTGRVANARWSQYLSDVCRLRSGPPRHKGASSGVGDYLRADRLHTADYYSETRRDLCSFVRWPEDFDPKAAANPNDFTARKVLLTGKVRPDSPWSSLVRVDFVGVVPTDAYIMVIPNQDALPRGTTGDDAIYALVALLGSTFVSAWIDERRTTRNISPYLYRNLPLPPGWSSLSDLGKELVRNASDPNAMRPLIGEVDARVFALYGLTSIEIEAFASRYSGLRGPEGSVRWPESDPIVNIAPSEDAMSTYGAVLDVTQTDLTLWAPGITPDEGVVVAPPPRMPGSLLWRGADFKVRADAGAILYGEFSLHAASWRSPLLTSSAPNEVDDVDDEDGLAFEDELLEDIDG